VSYELSSVSGPGGLIDISPVVDASIAVWPGDTPFVQTVNLDMAAGANLTLTDVRTTLHVGAHTDATSHYVAGGEDIASRSLNYYLGRCNVVHAAVPRGARILPAHVDLGTIDATRVLFRTGPFPDPRRWNDDFASLSPELIETLHERGVVLVGIDTPSVDPFDSKELESHHALARWGMANLEGLVLDGVEAGAYELIALPLRIRGGDASPVRAVLRLIE
jgi:arylformamidase